jgi:serine/threonine-protein kinase
VKLLDFGIARAEMKLRSVTPTGGLIKGKFAYMSPEQVRGAKLDGRSDVFSLGVVLWECLTGKRLFWNQADLQIMRNVLDAPIPRPSAVRPGLPAELDDVVMRALSRDLGQRYAHAGALAADLEPYLREARFSPDEQVKLLDDLFGDDDSLKEPDLPEDTAVEALPAASPTPATVNAHVPGDALPGDPGQGAAEPPADGDGAYTSVSVAQALPARGPRGLRGIALTAGGFAAAAGIAIVLARGGGRPDHVGARTVAAASPRGGAEGLAAVSPPSPGAPRPTAPAAPGVAPRAVASAPLEIAAAPAPSAPPTVPAIQASSAGDAAAASVQAARTGVGSERPSPQAPRQRRVAARAAVSPSSPELARGLAALRAGQLKLAQQELEAAVEADLTSPRAVGALAETEFELGLHARALLHARRAAQLAPSDAQYRVLEGDLCLKVGRPSDAVTAYRVASRLAPRDASIAERLQAAEQRAGR